MFKRTLSSLIVKASKQYSVISITGPRQSGKTTLSKGLFSDFAYFNLENPLTREFAKNDPKAFLAQDKKMVIDEIQRVPELFSYLQVIVDNEKKRKFVITGSQNFLISEKISQTLAGRIAIFRLLPLSLKELQNNKIVPVDIYKLLVKGGYPRLYDEKLDFSEWYANYIETYLQRDVREIKEIKNLSDFQTFLGLCAGRTGQILNLSSLANDAGVSVPTIKEWLSVLEASYVIYRLQPFYENFNKRLIKSPKIYFYDTGLACALLGIKTEKELAKHPLMGNIFETFVVSELQKQNLHRQMRLNFYYLRDKQGNEVDLLYKTGQKLHLLEIKSAQSFRLDFVKAFDYFAKISGKETENQIIYGGDLKQKRSNFVLLPWKEMCL